MKRFTVIPQNTFDGLQLDAGVVLRKFDVNSTGAPADEDIVCATTGGISVSCVPSYSDLGDDIDNVPANMKELKNLDSWACTMSFTSLGTDAKSIRLALGATNVNEETGAILPRRDLEQTDFADIWWVGDRADGGLVAVRLFNALSTGGFVLQTTKNGKGQISVELTGHVSMANQDKMPMEFYSMDPPDTITYSVTQNLTNVTSSYTDATVVAETSLNVTLTPDDGYTIDNITVVMNGVDISTDAVNGNTVTIVKTTGNVTITATAVANTGA